MPTNEPDQINVSFVHGFHESCAERDHGPRPALWTIQGERECTHRYVFPIEPRDFDALPYAIAGEGPLTTRPVEKLPRFGLTGLVRVGDHLFAGAWNGIYKLDADSKQVLSFLTNRYTCCIHRFHADDEQIIFVLPLMDLVVIMDHAGRTIDCFTIDRSLNVVHGPPAGHTDWRFVTKPWPGSTGVFHFNSVQRIGDELYLLSRNLGAFVVVGPGADRAALRTMNYWTPTCVHDGDFVDGRFYLTSIDGKILIASPPPAFDEGTFRYDLQVRSLRLDEVEKNWCRGMAVTDEHLYTTIDGRYGTDLSFGLLQLDREGRILSERRFQWANVGEEAEIRYVTGFDIVTAAS